MKKLLTYALDLKLILTAFRLDFVLKSRFCLGFLKEMTQMLLARYQVPLENNGKAKENRKFAAKCG